MQVKMIISLTKNNIFDFAILIILIGPIAAASVLHSVIYNGWRHFYFINPAFVVVVIRGFIVLTNFKYYRKTIREITILFLFLSFTTLCVQMINRHPLQYVYFNSFLGKNLGKKYPLDYADLGVLEGFKYLSINRNDQVFKIGAFGPLSITLSKTMLVLTDQQKSRFQLVDNINEADYIFSDYQFFNPQESIEFYKKIESYLYVYDLKVEGTSVLTVFKNN